MLNIQWEKKFVCSAAFLDVSQAFDKVWHSGLLLKLKYMLSNQYCEIIASYLKDRYFSIKQEDAYLNLQPIEAGIPFICFLLVTSLLTQGMYQRHLWMTQHC